MRAPQGTSDAVAIVGMAARLPGAANVDEFWDLLLAGRDAVTEVPKQRWDIDRYFGTDPDSPGKIVSRNGGFVPAVDQFDATFFGVAPREAHLMDPQQRLLLELHWEALENAGIDPGGLREAACGIYVGFHSHDYELLQAECDDADLDAYYATGNSASIAAGRLAYFFGTRGPAITVDTACSSSLVAVHQAVRSLRSGECDIAFASGQPARPRSGRKARTSQTGFPDPHDRSPCGSSTWSRPRSIWRRPASG
jgi:acyl transferase domain-containing protein